MAKSEVSKESNEELERYERIVNRAQREIEWVRKVYIWVFGFITLIFVAGVAFAVIFIGKDLADIKNRLNDEVGIVGRRVINRIDEEFKDENIHKLIVKQTIKRVDAVTDELIGRSVESKIEPKIKEVNLKLETLNNKTEIIKSDFANAIDEQKHLVDNFTDNQDKEMKIFKASLAKQFANAIDEQKHLVDNFTDNQDKEMKKTNTKITKQKETIDQLIKVANTHTKKLKEMIDFAKTPELLLSTHSVQKVEAGYEIKLKFKPPKDIYLGAIAFEVQVVNASAAKILDVSRAGTGISMNVKHGFSEDRKIATVQYTPMDSGLQQIKIQVSGICKLSISGNYLAKPFSIVVK